MIEKSALLLIRGDWPDNELLMVKEHHKHYWLFPGGKPEHGETIAEALVREVKEELAVKVVNFRNIGTVKGWTPERAPLLMHLFFGNTEGRLVASSEIETFRWFKRSDLHLIAKDLTPITVEKVLPLLGERKLW